MPGVRHHRRAPVVEVLDAADLHARRVDVDPVVGEQLLALEHQRDDEEVAVAQPLGGLAHGSGGGRRRARAPAIASGIVEMT